MNDNCYAHVDDNLNWNQAEDCCVAWGGHLASIHSAEVNSVLNDIRNKVRFTWIGLSDTANNGVYVWTDGTPFDYEKFQAGQPDSSRGESCFHFFNKARGELDWNDYHCGRTTWGRVLTSYICQKGELPFYHQKITIRATYKCNFRTSPRTDSTPLHSTHFDEDNCNISPELKNKTMVDFQWVVN